MPLHTGSKARISKGSIRFNKRQVRMGVIVEGEHHLGPRMARKIALDHLAENPKYYTKLKRAGL